MQQIQRGVAREIRGSVRTAAVPIRLATDGIALARTAIPAVKANSAREIIRQRGRAVPLRAIHRLAVAILGISSRRRAMRIVASNRGPAATDPVRTGMATGTSSISRRTLTLRAVVRGAESLGQQVVPVAAATGTTRVHDLTCVSQLRASALTADQAEATAGTRLAAVPPADRAAAKTAAVDLAAVTVVLTAVVDPTVAEATAVAVTAADIAGSQSRLSPTHNPSGFLPRKLCL